MSNSAEISSLKENQYEIIDASKENIKSGKVKLRRIFYCVCFFNTIC